MSKRLQEIEGLRATYHEEGQSMYAPLSFNSVFCLLTPATRLDRFDDLWDHATKEVAFHMQADLPDEVIRVRG